MNRDQSKITKKRSTLLTVCPFILVTEFCERLAYYGIATNLVVYLKGFGAANDQATILVSLFSGLCYTMPLVGGYIADAHAGRFLAILILSIVYCVGMLLLSLTALVEPLHPAAGQDANGIQWSALCFSLLLVAVGTGGIKPNVSTFGADQFDGKDPIEAKGKESFFNWFYLSINVGALIASTLIVQTQESIGWGVGFGIPGLAMVLAVLFFIAGFRLYKRLPPTGSVLGTFFKVTLDGFRRRRKRTVKKQSFENDTPGEGKGAFHCLDDAQAAGGHRQEDVYAVKLVWGVAPIFLTTIVFWMVSNQTNSAFILQGNLMNRHLGRLEIPSATLMSFDTLIIIVMVPLYDRVLIPWLRLCNIRITILQRIGIGYVITVVSMLAASTVEWKRLQLFNKGIVLDDEKEHEAVVVDMSVWWQSIQYVLIGAGEVFTSIGQIEFFYDQAPYTMRSVMSGISLFGVALGGYLATLVVALVNFFSEAFGRPWIADDLNAGRLDLYYLLLAGIMAVTTVVFVFLAKRYNYKVVDHEGETRSSETTAITMQGGEREDIVL